jgi:hypothetical protein
MCITVSLVSNFTATNILFNSGYPDAEASTSSRPPKWKLMRNIGIQNCLRQPEPDMKKQQVLLLPTHTQGFKIVFYYLSRLFFMIGA